MIVCHCEHIDCTTVRHAALAGERTTESVTEKCGAGGNCGGCRPRIARLLAELNSEPHPGERERVA